MSIKRKKVTYKQVSQNLRQELVTSDNSASIQIQVREPVGYTRFCKKCEVPKKEKNETRNPSVPTREKNSTIDKVGCKYSKPIPNPHGSDFYRLYNSSVKYDVDGTINPLNLKVSGRDYTVPMRDYTTEYKGFITFNQCLDDIEIFEEIFFKSFETSKQHAKDLDPNIDDVLLKDKLVDIISRYGPDNDTVFKYSFVSYRGSVRGQIEAYKVLYPSEYSNSRTIADEALKLSANIQNREKAVSLKYALQKTLESLTSPVTAAKKRTAELAVLDVFDEYFFSEDDAEIFNSLSFGTPDNKTNSGGLQNSLIPTSKVQIPEESRLRTGSLDTSKVVWDDRVSYLDINDYFSSVSAAVGSGTELTALLALTESIINVAITNEVVSVIERI